VGLWCLALAILCLWEHLQLILPMFLRGWVDRTSVASPNWFGIEAFAILNSWVDEVLVKFGLLGVRPPPVVLHY
jgi:hypothetical protein